MFLSIPFRTTSFYRPYLLKNGIMFCGTSNLETFSTTADGAIDGAVQRVKVNKLADAELSEVVGKFVRIQGWVRTVRTQKLFSFVEINDGSSLLGVQAVIDPAVENCSDISR